jgi:membrane protein required for colicin V production
VREPAVGEPVNWVDLTLVTVFCLFGLRGYFKGLFREVLSLGGLIVGFMAAVAYHATLATLARSYLEFSPFVLRGLAFVAIFLFVYLLFNLAGWLLHRSAKFLFLQTVNRFGGIVVAVGKGAAAAALVLFFVTSSPWLTPSSREKLHGSVLAPPLVELGEGLVRAGKKKLFPTDTAAEKAVASPRA